MAAISAGTKGKIGLKAVSGAYKHPRLLRLALPAGRLGVKAGKPLAKRRLRQEVERFGDATRSIGEILVIYGPPVAYELGLAERPKPKRTAPRVAVGIVIGASAMYFLKPEHGHE